MKRLSILCFMLFTSCFFGASLGFSQTNKTKQIEQRTKNKAENRVDQKIDSGIDKGLDAVEGLFKKKNKNSNNNSNNNANNSNSGGQGPGNSGKNQGNANEAPFNPMAMFGGGSSDVQLRPVYSFTDNFIYDVSFEEKKGKKANEMKMQYFIGEDGEYLGMKYLQGSDVPAQAQDATMILEGTQMVSFVEANATKMAMIIPFDAVDTGEAMNADEPDEKFDIKKTGNTKTILGYTCHEYQMEDEETIAQMWIAPELTDLSRNMGGIFGMMAQNNKKASKGASVYGLVEGMMMEMNYTDKKDNSSTKMVISEINLGKSSSFSSQGYQVMNMGNFMKGGKD